MCDLGIGGFMGIEDIQPGMKIDLKVAGQGDTDVYKRQTQVS